MRKKCNYQISLKSHCKSSWVLHCSSAYVAFSSLSLDFCILHPNLQISFIYWTHNHHHHHHHHLCIWKGFNKKQSSKKLQLQQHFTNMYSESKGKGVIFAAKQKDPICQTELHHPVGLSLIAVRDINTRKQMRVRRGKSSALPCPWLPSSDRRSVQISERCTSSHKLFIVVVSSSHLLFLSSFWRRRTSDFSFRGSLPAAQHSCYLRLVRASTRSRRHRFRICCTVAAAHAARTSHSHELRHHRRSNKIL